MTTASDWGPPRVRSGNRFQLFTLLHEFCTAETGMRYHCARAFEGVVHASWPVNFLPLAAAVQVGHNAQRRPSCRRPWTGGGRKWRRRATWQARWPTFGVPAGRTPLIKGPPRSSNAGSAKAAAGEVGGTAKRRPPKGTRGPACQGPLQGGWAASIARRQRAAAAALEAQRRCCSCRATQDDWRTVSLWATKEQPQPGNARDPQHWFCTDP